MDRERIKRYVKACVPWRLRYFIKLQEAKEKIHLGDTIKQHRTIEEYNAELYEVLQTFGINDFKGKTVCEMGPGEFLSHAFLEYQLGSDKEILLEIGDYAGINCPVDQRKLELDDNYQSVRPLPKLNEKETWGGYLQKINAIYSINGLEGYREVADDSVDYVFSFAVLEHIRKKTFQDTMLETYRFMKSGGMAYHTVDYKDHLGGKKNQLRFQESVWEDDTHYRLDNYTNRIACSEMCKILTDIGFEIKNIRKRKFRKLPIRRSRLASCFFEMSDEDLLTESAVIVLKKN